MAKLEQLYLNDDKKTEITPKLSEESIQSIPDQAITGFKIRKKTITSDHIIDGGVHSFNIADKSITEEKLDRNLNNEINNMRNAFQYEDDKTQSLKDLYRYTVDGPIAYLKEGDVDLKDYYTKDDINAQMSLVVGKNELDRNYYTKVMIDNKLSNKQDKLLSGTNIKTVNGQSLLGSGDIKISSGEDELLGTWKFNDNLTTMSRNTSYGNNIEFKSNNYTYKNFYISYLSDGYSLIYDTEYEGDYLSGNSNTTNYVDLETPLENDSKRYITVWYNEAYKTITITDTSNLTNREEFTTWLKNNATKQKDYYTREELEDKLLTTYTITLTKEQETLFNQNKIVTIENITNLNNYKALKLVVGNKNFTMLKAITNTNTLEYNYNIVNGNVILSISAQLLGTRLNISKSQKIFISIDEKGSANGVASLDGSGKVPISQLPETETVDLSNYYNKTEVDTKLNTKENKGTSYTKAEIETKLDTKQAVLISGDNIKTVNGQNLLGSGNISVNVSTGVAFIGRINFIDIGLSVNCYFTITGFEYADIEMAKAFIVDIVQLKGLNILSNLTISMPSSETNYFINFNSYFSDGSQLAIQIFDTHNLNIIYSTFDIDNLEISYD